MKVKQACRRDRPGGEPQGKGGAPTNRGQKESSACFSSISIAKLSLCFELCKACAVFLRRCLLISIFPRAELEYVCPPRVTEAKEGNCSGERTGRQSGTGVKNAAPSGENAEQNRNTPAGRFISSPLFSYRCCRNVCCVRPESTPCAPIACARTLASTGFRFLPSLLHPNATLCCE